MPSGSPVGTTRTFGARSVVGIRMVSGLISPWPIVLIGAFKVFDGHVVAGQGGNPTVAQGIKIWCRKKISEWIVVRQHGKWPVLQVLPELFCNGQLKGQELQLGRMVFGFSPFQLTTSESNGVSLAVWLLLGEYCTQSFR